VCAGSFDCVQKDMGSSGSGAVDVTISREGRENQHRTFYTPYFCWSCWSITGGNAAVSFAHPAASCCLKPWRILANMSFSSGDGWVHLTMALQNHSKLWIDVSFRCFQSELPSHLSDPSRISLDKCTEPSEGGVLLFVVPDLVERLTPTQCKLWQEWSNKARVHQPNPSYRDSSVLV
jgi:hypothetical protein